jgi:hypothetical protein
VYKFGGQPVVKNAVQQGLGGLMSNFWCEAIAGSLVGAGEVVLLPLDALKIKMQASPEAAKKGVVATLREEGFRNLYKGTLWTIARNVPGSFALFGASALVKERVFGLTGAHRKKATLAQHFVASLAGSVASIVVSSPMDTIKVSHLPGFSSVSSSPSGLTDVILSLLLSLIGVSPFQRRASRPASTRRLRTCSATRAC